MLRAAMLTRETAGGRRVGDDVSQANRNAS